MGTTIRWLHLTDLHVGMDDQDWLWPGMRARFRYDLQKIYNTAGPWDLVLFTGDLVQKGTEYEKLDEIFEELWQWFNELGCQPQLLAVPGNHDLQWRDAKDPVVKQLYRWEDDHEVPEEFWNWEKDQYRQPVQEAFAAYDKWWRETPLKPVGVQHGRLPGDFSCTLVKDGFRLGIVGLNSAFLQLTEKRGEGSFEGHMALHPRQFHAACDGKDGVKWAESHHACFLMTHHPPEWLNPESREWLDQEIRENFQLHLCGHDHEPKVRQVSTAGASHAPLWWLGRSVFGLEKFEDGKTDRSHGYVAGELRLGAKRKGHLQFMPRRRELQDSTWKLVPDHSVKLQKNERTRSFPICVRVNPKMHTGTAGTAEEKGAAGDSGKPDTVLKELLPNVLQFLRNLPASQPDLYGEFDTALRQEMACLQTSQSKTGSLDLIELTRRQGVNKVLDALFRWLDRSPRRNAPIADWREVLTHLVVLAAANPDWLREARNQRDRDGVVPVDEKLVQEKLQPLSAAVLVSGLFDIAICLEGTQPAGHIPLAPGRGDKGHDSRDRYKAMIEFLQQKYRKFFTDPLDEAGIKQMLKTDRDHNNPRFVYLPEGDQLASEISDKLNGWLTVFVEKTAPRVLEKNGEACVLDQSLRLVRNIQELLEKLK